MKYEIRLAKDGKYYFVLVAKNGEIIATSETYFSRQACKNGIAAIKRSWFANIVDYTKF